MTEPTFDGTIETVRGRLTEEREEQLMRFWADRGALEGAAARERLPEVVCLLLDAEGEIAGVNSVFPDGVGPIGDRPFWLYRSFLLPEATGAAQGMIAAAFTALEREFDPDGEGPLGLCVLVSDPAALGAGDEAVWPETELLYAGRLPDGRQLRIRYFEEAAIGPALPNSPTLEQTRHLDTELQDRFRIEPFEIAGITPEEVIAFWEREDAVAGEEAKRRVEEVHLVALERDEGLVGVSSTYLQRNEQLGMDLWYYRAFVGEAHRMSNLAVLLAITGRERLKRRFTDGEDTRGAGVVYEVENPGLKQYFNKALWMPTEFTFIGENRRGDHVRVHWFPGAVVPPRPTAS